MITAQFKIKQETNLREPYLTPSLSLPLARAGEGENNAIVGSPFRRYCQIET